MNGPVVVGVDGSPSSLAAVETAALVAERRGTGLRLAHALTFPRALVPPGVAPWDPEGAAGLSGVVNRRLAEAERHARRVAPRVAITREVLMGEPGTVLASQSRDASLTVLGSRPVHGLASLLHGSVAGWVTVHGLCPVLVVRSGARSSGPVVLVDDESPAAAEFAFSEAAERGAELVVLHTHAHPADRSPDGPAKKYPDVVVRDLRVRARTGRSLVEASAGAQLVVMAAHHTAAEMLWGSPGRTLLSQAACPVAVVPAGSA